MNMRKKLTALLLAVMLMISVFPFSASAAAENTPKEEVVYINLNTDGSVKEIVVVNIFDLDKDGQIIDYGKYESLKNMTTTDKIHYENDTVSINAKAGKLYYEGRLSSNAMPWNIAIRYFMDGKEYSGSEIAGMSGNLKITMQITENKKFAGSFFEGYALQASFTLDTNKCSNITAEGATVANVGSDKQLTYTILPNKGADVEISAQVKDFEMNAVAINGIKLNLSIEIDDTKLTEKIDEITGAVGKVDNGASDLNEGAEELYDGTQKLYDKGDDLEEGVSALNKGAADLASGLNKLTENNQALINGANAGMRGLCLTSETILNAKLTDFGLDPVSLTPDNYGQVLGDLLSMLGYKESSAQAQEEDQNQNVRPASVLDDAIASLLELKTNLDNYKTFCNGVVSYTSGVSEAASGAEKLKTNMNTLDTNVGNLVEAFEDLNEGAKALYEGTTDLKDGTNEFATQTEDIDDKVSEEIENMISAATGREVEVVSFVSEDNDNVEAVQFVIRTEAIVMTEALQDQQVTQENLTFWQKLLRLFVK